MLFHVSYRLSIFSFAVVPDKPEADGDAAVTVQRLNRQPKPKWSSVSSAVSERNFAVWEGEELEHREVNMPVDYFRYFFDENILDHLVLQSNLYSVQNNPNKPLNITRNELEQFFGICMVMSIFGLPRSRMYWAKNTQVEKVSSVMSRDRWEEIKRNLHCNDNTAQVAPGDPNRDKLFKVRPLIDSLQVKFRELPKTQFLCVDEQIVPFKGRSGLKQYNPKKPNKWGYKIFILCSSKGLVHNFEVYTGSIQPLPGAPDLGASSNVVLRMTQDVPQNKGYLVFFDNWFASLPLFTTLASVGIGALGTIRPNRFPGLELPADLEMKKKGRGYFVEKEVNVDGIEVRAMKWYDNRGVSLATTFDSAEPSTQVKRFDRKLAAQTEVTCPRAVITYNKFMGGVDLLDGLVSYYRIKIRSKKFYHRIIFHFIDMAVVNSWLMYREDCRANGIKAKDTMDLLEFKCEIHGSLCMQGKDLQKKRGRPSADRVDTEHEQKKLRGPAKPIPCFTSRRDGTGHWPIATGDRQRCKMPNCNGQTTIKCGKCAVHLCLIKQRNCFVSFHL